MDGEGQFDKICTKLSVMGTDGCSRCAEVERRATKYIKVVPLKDDLDAYLKKETSEFLKNVNACMNTEGGGTLIIHAEIPQQLEQFDQKVDDKLRELITDNRQFCDHFERSFYKDKNHVMIRVKPRVPHSMISTFQSHTRTSLNKGLASQRQGEMLELIQKIAEEELPVNSLPHTSAELQRLKQGEEVHICVDGIEQYMQESLRVQAKGHDKRKTSDLPFPYLSNNDELKDPQDIQEYIGAFASVPGGGSWFSGIGEKECPRSATIFVAHGYTISDEQQKDIKQKLGRRFPEKLIWVGQHAPSNPVEVRFHDLDEGQDLRVVEAKVKYFHGLCFKRKPEAYYFEVTQPDQVPQIKCYELEEWLSLLSKQDPLQKEFSRMQMRIEHLENQIPMVQEEIPELQVTTRWQMQATRLQNQMTECQTDLANLQEKLASLKKQVPVPAVDVAIGQEQTPRLQKQVPIFEEPMDTS